jgi:hypothetical protein
MRSGFDANAPSDGRVDLSPLDPLADPIEFERTLSRIRSRAEPVLRARRAVPDVWCLVASWRRPVLVASGLLACAAVLTLVSAGARERQVGSLTEAAGLPRTVAEWVEGGQTLTPAALLGWEEAQ